MARPRFKDLPPENQRVLRAWRDAKKRNPDLTEADFAMTIWPEPKSTKRMSAFMGSKERHELHKRQRQSRARYFRLVAEGKRVPKNLNYRADNPSTRDLLNVVIGRGDNSKSFNLIIGPEVSRLDAFKLLQTPGLKTIINKMIKAWNQRYAELGLTANSPMDIRGIRRSTKPEQILYSTRSVNG